MVSMVRTLPSLILLWIVLSVGGCSSVVVENPAASESLRVQDQKYNRKLYKHWIDEDKDCQNTRAEILIATSLIEPKFKSERKCVVTSGKWFDKYSGSYIYDAKKVDIDHIVPLKKAHSLGARYWEGARREQFANDPTNLLPVSLRLNRQKGAKGPTKWMPPSQTYHCDYLIQWSSVTKKYNLKLAENPADESWIQTKTKSCEEPIRLPAEKGNSDK